MNRVSDTVLVSRPSTPPDSLMTWREMLPVYKREYVTYNLSGVLVEKYAVSSVCSHLPCSNAGEARGDSSMLKNMIPSFGRFSLGATSSHDTWAMTLKSSTLILHYHKKYNLTILIKATFSMCALHGGLLTLTHTSRPFLRGFVPFNPLNSFCKL